MAEITLLRTSAINRNGAARPVSAKAKTPAQTSEVTMPEASVPVAKPVAAQDQDARRSVTTGGLSPVQVKTIPGGPQIHGDPSKSLTAKDAGHAVAAGGLSLVQTKAVPGAPQVQGNQSKTFVLLPPRDMGRSVVAGGLPPVQLKMTPGGPQVLSEPRAQRARAQLQNAPSALSQPRVARAQVPQAVQEPELTADQLLLCRHLVDKYLGEQRVGDGADAAVTVDTDNVKLAEATISTIDATMIARTIAAAQVAPVVGHVALRPRVLGTGPRSQINAGMAPRRMGRPAASAPPMVSVKMEGDRPALVEEPSESSETIESSKATDESSGA
jgi:hypothetical protein